MAAAIILCAVGESGERKTFQRAKDVVVNRHVPLQHRFKSEKPSFTPILKCSKLRPAKEHTISKIPKGQRNQQIDEDGRQSSTSKEKKEDAVKAYIDWAIPMIVLFHLIMDNGRGMTASSIRTTSRE